MSTFLGIFKALTICTLGNFKVPTVNICILNVHTINNLKVPTFSIFKFPQIRMRWTFNKGENFESTKVVDNENTTGRNNENT